MVEHQLKGLFYNCDEKYFPGYKCKEHKLFMDISEYFSNEDVEVYSEAKLHQTYNLSPPDDSPKFEPLVSLNDLTIFYSP
jgi:hypothetical protein